MNRRDRRAAQKRSRSLPDAAGENPGELLAEAAQLAARGAFADAERYYRRALTLDPNRQEAYVALGQMLLRSGNPEAALGLAVRALRMDETHEAKALFAACAELLNFVAPPPELRSVALRALSEPWIRPANLMGFAIRLVQGNEAMRACVQRAMAAWPGPLTHEALFGPAGIGAVAQDRLLRCALQSGPVNDLGLERFLTLARRVLLEEGRRAKPAKDADEAVLDLWCSLAEQCFINEYAFALGSDEAAQAADMREVLAAALDSGARIAAPLVIAVAAYFPLHTVAKADRLLGMSWPRPVQRLLRQQVREPLQEAEYRAELAQLTPIGDDAAPVREQYEESPYPRWVRTALAPAAVPLETYLRERLPAAAIPPLHPGDSVDYLAAGCGTGQWLCEQAGAIAGARVLAIDVSRASLAYAKRKAPETGLSNIEFAQADLTNIAALGRTFDLIECSGVLHHLTDPLAAWRALLPALKAGGVMRVGLYSEIARKDIVAAQRFARERGYTADADSIRRLRQEILAQPADAALQMVAHVQDFCSTSGVRDLLLHTRERRLSLPEIARFIEAEGLKFLGFEIHGTAREQFRRRFPRSPHQTELDLWHRFEQDHPYTFINMYQFWVQKPA
jgi:SAM-dependent methyltransferase